MGIFSMHLRVPKLNFSCWRQEHAVIESKPDHFLDDLRLNNPWPELKRYMALSLFLFVVDILQCISNINRLLLNCISKSKKFSTLFVPFYVSTIGFLTIFLKHHLLLSLLCMFTKISLPWKM